MEKLDKVIRCLELCYRDECESCDYCGNGCSEVLMRDALKWLKELRTDNERYEKRWTEARNDLIDEQMRSRDYEKKVLIARAERDTARRKILELEAKVFKLEQEAENE